METYRINIVGLSNKVHQFDYEVGNPFFHRYGTELVKEGAFTATILLDKHETFLEAKIQIHGTARLICDRSLDEFNYPVDVENLIIFKYGEEDRELDDDVMMISHDTVSIEFGQYIYEFIALAIPMKKLHPRFEETADDEDTPLVYSSKDATPPDQDNDIDPRWDKLKKLKE